jgi:hypothetical protein
MLPGFSEAGCCLLRGYVGVDLPALLPILETSRDDNSLVTVRLARLAVALRVVGRVEARVQLHEAFEDALLGLR